jgi:hypothetical protein
MLGTTGVPAFSGADGDGDTTIDSGDHAVWTAHFGQVLPLPDIGSASPMLALRTLNGQIRDRAMAQSTVARTEVDRPAFEPPSVPALERQSHRQASSSLLIGRIQRYQVKKSAADDLLLTLAIDRALRASPQDCIAPDNPGGDDDAKRSDRPDPIDGSFALAVAEWPWPNS